MSSGLTTIFIDDIDTTRVEYAGSWKAKNDTREFDSTVHGSSGNPGDQVTIQFTGRSIQVIGTVAKEGEGDDSISIVQLNFQLDSTDLPSYRHTLPEDDSLYSHTVLKHDFPEGDHTLTISVEGTGTPDPNTPVFYFNYALVTTNSTPTENDLVFIDDTDPSIAYRGNWYTNGAMHSTRDASSQLLFNFRGTYLKVIGLASRSGHSASIEGSGGSAFGPGSEYEWPAPQSIFQRWQLPNQVHKLTLSPRSNEEFSLDCILYRPSPGPPALNPGSSQGLGGGAIAGVVVGGIALVALMGLGWLWRIKRSRRRRNSKGLIEEDEAKQVTPTDLGGIPGAQQPFVATPPLLTIPPTNPAPPMEVTYAQAAQNANPTSETGSSSISVISDKTAAGHAGSSSQPLVLSWTPPRTLPPIVHEDSGVRLDDDEHRAEQREELPPAYRPYYPSRPTS